MENMKKVLATMAAVTLYLSLATSVFAEGTSYGMAGCGLGSLVFGNTSDGASQVLAATTNGTSYNQLFGLTSGTSNCPSMSQTAGRERLNEFVASNLDSLAKEIAVGNGESLDTLAELMGVSVDQRTTVYARLQSNFSTIFPSEQVQAGEVIDHIAMVINP